jgi:K+-transporting ATPase KdpF subunit
MVRESYERRNLCIGNGCFLCLGNSLPESLRKIEVRMAAMLGNIALIVISILLCAYLLYALLKPEKF